MTRSTSVALLYRRFGFGASPDELAAATKAGYDATVRSLLAGLGGPDPGADAVPTPSFSVSPLQLVAAPAGSAARRALAGQLRTEGLQLMAWWVARMVATTNPLREKLTLLLHDHFPTAISKVRFAAYMHRQNELFRTIGAGPFDALTLAVATDPAMLIWLDAGSDKASDPNENFARELMERFTMGIGTYTEADVRAAAYCFTGWRLDVATGTFAVSAANHGPLPQTFLGQTGVNAGQQVIDIVTHTAASTRFVPASFWSLLAYPVTTADPVVRDLAADYTPQLNMTSLLGAIARHPAFTSAQALGGLVKQPIEWLVGTLRALRVAPDSVAAGKVPIVGALAGMGQVPFDPPSVGGWGRNQFWLSTAAGLARWQFAAGLAAGADLSAVADAPARSRIDAVSELLGVESWSASSVSVLGAARSSPPELVTLALVSPEYVSN
jgi:uncharacterized protein (DUF1800 family)